MATNYRKIWGNWDTKLFQASDSNGATVTLPDLLQYETLPLQVVLLEDDPDDLIAGYKRLDVSNISLTVSVNDTLDDASPLAEQSDWTKDTDTNKFTGNLELNTAGMNTYMDANTKPVYFQVEAVEGSARVRWYQLINIKRSVTQVTTTSPNPAAEYLTKAQSIGLFLQPRLDAGAQITLVSPDGSKTRTLGISNNGEFLDIYDEE